MMYVSPFIRFSLNHLASHGLLYTRAYMVLKENRVGHFGATCGESTMTSVSSTCREHAGTKLPHANNHWGNYGHSLLFAVRVNKSINIKFLIFSLSQYVDR